jgi:outer membrane lipoprotein-sorting protein
VNGVTAMSLSARERDGLRAMLLAAVLALLPAVADAQPATADTAPVAMPLPHLRPRTAAAADNGATEAANALAAPQVNVPYDPNSPFNAEQQTALAHVEAYFNSFSLMEGRFVQIAPDGSQSEGVFFLSKPGRIRFHYSPPARMDVISDGSSVAVKDGKAGTQDLYPLSKTPLRWLLTSNIDLSSARMVKDVGIAKDLITVTIVEKGAFVQGTLTLIFDRKTYELRQWQVTDAQGLTTSVAIFDTALNKPQTDPGLYRIDAFGVNSQQRP